ncbi:MAG: hypothetical protein WBL20_22640 [Sphingobium sp.]
MRGYLAKSSANADYFLTRHGGDRLTVKPDHSVQDINRDPLWHSGTV